MSIIKYFIILIIKVLAIFSLFAILEVILLNLRSGSLIDK